MLQAVIEKTIRKKEAQTSKTETLQDTSRGVRHLQHLAGTYFPTPEPKSNETEQRDR